MAYLLQITLFYFSPLPPPFFFLFSFPPNPSFPTQLNT